jgi:NAD(P)-dependent dehydrogenase (short-subunit alcohol dehydrogenase family)
LLVESSDLTKEEKHDDRGEMHKQAGARRDKELGSAVKDIGRNVSGVHGDVSKLSDLDRLFAQIKREKGKIDIVFANAGVSKYASFGKITEELYDSFF